MQHQAYPGTAGSFEDFSVDPEWPYLASGEEHHVPAFHLQAIVTRGCGGKLCGRRLQHYVLGAEVKCGVR
jgi:hypothetical protein